MSYIAERRQEEKDRRRAEIIEAAEGLYGELGWDAVTMESVAKRARLSRALVYVYFKDKTELHFAITIRALQSLHQRFSAASAGASTGAEKIRAIGEAYITYGREIPHYFDACARLQLHTSENPEPGSHERTIHEVGDSIHQIVVAVFKAGQQDGTLRTDLGNLDVTARVLWGFMHGLIQIAMTKSAELAQSGISVPQLMEQAISLTMFMLTGRNEGSPTT